MGLSREWRESTYPSSGYQVEQFFHEYVDGLHTEFMNGKKFFHCHNKEMAIKVCKAWYKHTGQSIFICCVVLDNGSSIVEAFPMHFDNVPTSE